MLSLNNNFNEMKKYALYLKWSVIIFSFHVVFLIVRQIWRLIKQEIGSEIFFGISTSQEIGLTYYTLMSIILCIILIYLLYLLSILLKVSNDLIANQLFKKDNFPQLQKFSKGLLIFGLLLLISDLALKIPFIEHSIFDKNISYSFGYILGYTISRLFYFFLNSGLPIFIAALLTLFISKYNQKGYILKQENDLTI